MIGSRRTWSAVALLAGVVLAGAGGTLAVAALAGMGGGALLHLALVLMPAALVTVAASALAGSLLTHLSIFMRMLAVAVIAVVASVANLAVLTMLMVVDDHDALLVGTLMVYSAGAGVGAALVHARASVSAVRQLVQTAQTLGGGDLGARVGELPETGHELNALGRTLDEMADRLQTAIERERSAEARRRDLMTAVSHDLRTPLSTLRAMVEAIDDGVVDDLPSLRRYAVEMRGSVDSLVTLVDDLFELAQLDVGAIEAETARARLADVVHSAVSTCELQALQKGLLVHTDLNGADEAVCSPRLSRVLQNLLQNAIRHTPSDGTVRIEARRGAGKLELAVEDTGEGIPPESLDRVFEPFWRGDPARVGAGSGLGLALAKRIVEALGGSITAESRPIRGARIELVVPE
jgi:signal transduction histidine kinase